MFALTKQNRNIYKPFILIFNMARYREIKKYGNTFVIPLTKPDMEDMKFKEGEMVDVEKLKLKKGEDNGNKKS